MISAAQLLDELMGRDRNLAPDEKRSNVRWDHESVSAAGAPLTSLLRCSRALRGAGGLLERHGRLLWAGENCGEGEEGRGEVLARAGVPRALSGCGSRPPCWALHGGLGRAGPGRAREQRRAPLRRRRREIPAQPGCRRDSPAGCESVPAGAAVNANWVSIGLVVAGSPVGKHKNKVGRLEEFSTSE